MRARAMIVGRQTSYLQTFDLTSQPNLDTLADLARFCRANTSTFDPDPRIHALLEGRREVWLRIQNHLNMSPETIFSLIERGASK